MLKFSIVNRSIVLLSNYLWSVKNCVYVIFHIKLLIALRQNRGSHKNTKACIIQTDFVVISWLPSLRNKWFKENRIFSLFVCMLLPNKWIYEDNRIPVDAHIGIERYITESKDSRNGREISEKIPQDRFSLFFILI